MSVKTYNEFVKQGHEPKDAADLAEREDAKEAVKALGIMTNVMTFKPDSFVEELNREHRTLQQKNMEAFLAWVWHLSQLKEGEYDLRNSAAVEMAKTIVAQTGIKYTASTVEGYQGKYDEPLTPRERYVWPIRFPFV